MIDFDTKPVEALTNSDLCHILEIHEALVWLKAQARAALPDDEYEIVYEFLKAQNANILDYEEAASKFLKSR